MSNTKTFDEGAKILQNVDVSSMVTALALGIASAQERLDTNSVSQLIRLAETKVGEKSLLELGFQPAFYAFDYADISASISLKMAVKEEVEVDLSIAVDYTKNATFNKDFFDQLKKSRNKSLSKKSTTKREVSLEANYSEEITVNEKSFEIHKEEGSYSKIEKAKEEIRNESTDLRVDNVIEDERVLEEHTSNDLFILKEDGFVVVAEPYVHTDTEGLLKMEANYSVAPAPTVTIKGTGGSAKKFDKDVSFGDTLSAARTANGTGGETIGIKSDGIYRAGGKKEYEFFFGWDKYDIDYTYSNGVNSNGVDQGDVTLLALLMERDPSLNITIKGYTDGSGNSSPANTTYNSNLGNNRAEAFKKELIKRANSTAIGSRITTVTKGETLSNGSSAKDPIIRKVTVEFDSTTHDYIHFNGGNIKKSDIAGVPATDEFVYLEEDNSSGKTNLPIVFKYNGKSYTISRSDLNDALKASNNFKSKIEEFYAEKYNDFYYLLHEETKVNYFVHSEKNKEIDIKAKSQASADYNKDTTKIFISETENDLSKLKESTKDFKGDNSLAISGSLDVRYARQFSMSTEGNASVSARMISVPAPTGLENYIQSLTGSKTTPSSN